MTISITNETNAILMQKVAPQKITTAESFSKVLRGHLDDLTRNADTSSIPFSAESKSDDVADLTEKDEREEEGDDPIISDSIGLIEQEKDPQVSLPASFLAVGWGHRSAVSQVAVKGQVLTVDVDRGLTGVPLPRLQGIGLSDSFPAEFGAGQSNSKVATLPLNQLSVGAPQSGPDTVVQANDVEKVNAVSLHGAAPVEDALLKGLAAPDKGASVLTKAQVEASSLTRVSEKATPLERATVVSVADQVLGSIMRPDSPRIEAKTGPREAAFGLGAKSARQPHEGKLQINMPVQAKDGQIGDFTDVEPDPLLVEKSDRFDDVMRHQSPVALTTSVSGAGQVPARQVAAAISQQIAVAVSKNPDGTTELVLNPEELGRVSLSMKTHEGAVSLVITTERPETQDLMRRHIELLTQDLRSLGFNDVGYSFEGHGQGRENSETTVDGRQPSSGNADADVVDLPQIDPRQDGLDLRL